MRNLLFSLCALALATASCKQGCTDFSASNFDDTATKDDGSCFYEGCTDPDASNYWSRAETDNGTCLYPSDVVFFNNLDVQDGFKIELYWEEEYVGRFLEACNGGVTSCESGCPAVDIRELDPGTYSYEAFLRPGNATLGGESVFSGTISIGATQCRFIVLQ